jgi:hypothetical protein
MSTESKQANATDTSSQMEHEPEENHHLRDVSDLNNKWTLFVTQRKRANSNDDHSTTVRPSKLAHKIPPTLPLSNRFQPLQNSGDPEGTVSKKLKVPPIILKTDVKYLELCKILTQLVGNDQFKCSSTLKNVTINPSSPESYRKIVNFLRANKAEFHTFQLPEDKAFRVVIRGLHSSVEPDAVKEELISKGFSVQNVTNVWSREKSRLPLFFVDLDQSQANDNIFDLTTLLYSKVQVEEPRPKRLIVQCMRCQQLGHTKKYCNRSPKCVKCAKDHETSSCTKPNNTPATCALCGENHPANYRGCVVHRELQNRRSSKTNTNTTKEATRPRTQPPPDLSPSSFPQLPKVAPHSSHVSYQPTRPTSDTNSNDEHNYARKLQNSSRTNNNTSNQTDIIVTHLTSILTEFKALFTPLLTMMTQLMQVLINKHDK